MSDTSEDYWNKIGGQVLTELERRLGHGADAKDLPGTLLMRLAEQYLKYLDKKAQEQEEEAHYMTAMEAIDQEGLPLDVKVQILSDYIVKLEEDMMQAVTRHAELEAELGTAPLHEPDPSLG